MSPSISSQAHDQLRRLSVAGAGLAGQDAGLKRLTPQLKRAGAKASVFARLGQQLEALAAAGEDAQAGLLFPAIRLTQAVLSAQASAAPEGASLPLAQPPPGRRSERRSSQLLVKLRGCLTSSGPGRQRVLWEGREALSDLRVAPLLAPALDDPALGEVAERALRSALGLASGASWGELPEVEVPGLADAGLIDAIIDSFSGRPAADLRRVELVCAAAPERGPKMALSLLERGVKPALKEPLYRALGSEPAGLGFLVDGARAGPAEAKEAALIGLAGIPGPEALQALLQASKKGSTDLRRTAFAGLAQRPEPEAEQAIREVLGKRSKKREGEQPLSFDLLISAFQHFNEALQDTLRERMQDEEIPAYSDGAVWGRDSWAEALSCCTPSEQTIAALVSAAEGGWIDWCGLEMVQEHATQEDLRRLIPREVRAGMLPDPDDQMYKVFFLRAASRRLPPEEVFELLSEGYAADAELIEAIAFDAGPPSAHPVAWDRRWLELAIRDERVDLLCALVGPGDEAAIACLWEALPRRQGAGAVTVLQALQRAGAEGVNAAVFEQVEAALSMRRLHSGEIEERRAWAQALRALLSMLDPEALVSALPRLIALEPKAQDALRWNTDARDWSEEQRERAEALFRS